MSRSGRESSPLGCWLLTPGNGVTLFLHGGDTRTCLRALAAGKCQLSANFLIMSRRKAAPESQRHLFATHSCVQRSDHSVMTHPSKNGLYLYQKRYIHCRPFNAWPVLNAALCCFRERQLYGNTNEIMEFTEQSINLESCNEGFQHKTNIDHCVHRTFMTSRGARKSMYVKRQVHRHSVHYGTWSYNYNHWLF